MAKTMMMPKIGVNMTEGIVTEWFVGEGDTIAAGQVILSAETDKAVQEIEATDSGRIAMILVAEGETAVCQEPILILGAEGEDISELLTSVRTGGKAGQGGELSEPNGRTTGRADSPDHPTPARAVGSGRVRISPLARALAREHAIPLERLEPAEPGFRIVKADVLRSASRKTGEEIPPTAVRRATARQMSASNREVPQAVLNVRVDAEVILTRRERDTVGDWKPSLTSYLVHAAARAVQEHPGITGQWSEAAIRMPAELGIGVAVETDRGLVVPVIRNPQTLSISEIDRDLSGKTERARSGLATVADLTGGTFTVSNLVMVGVDSFIPIVNPPECAILAIGAISPQPVWDPKAALFIPVRCFQASLAFDHRAIDGAPAGRFLVRFKELVEREPEAVGRQSRD